MKIFVSYSRRDAGDFAEALRMVLQDESHDVFTDVNDIQIGSVWSSIIEHNISDCDIFIVLVTYAALRSPHVEKEVLQAQSENKMIIPCFHMDVSKNELKWDLGRLQGINFNEKYELARKLYSKISKFRPYPESLDSNDDTKVADISKSKEGIPSEKMPAPPTPTPTPTRPISKIKIAIIISVAAAIILGIVILVIRGGDRDDTNGTPTPSPSPSPSPEPVAAYTHEEIRRDGVCLGFANSEAYCQYRLMPDGNSYLNPDHPFNQ